jgi:HK97 family phage major capsid protein
VNGPLTYGPLITAVETLMAANADVSRVAAIMSPRSWGQLARLEETSTGNVGQAIRRPPALDAVTIMPTASVPNTFSSTGSTAASGVFLGDFSQFIIGSRLDSRVEVLRERYAQNFQYGFLGFQRADVGWQHDESFVKVTAVTT